MKIIPLPPTIDALCMKIDMWLTPNLISKPTLNFNFSVNYEDHENDQDNENHPGNENEGNYPAKKYMFKVTINLVLVFLM